MSRPALLAALAAALAATARAGPMSHLAAQWMQGEMEASRQALGQLRQELLDDFLHGKDQGPVGDYLHDRVHAVEAEVGGAWNGLTEQVMAPGLKALETFETNVLGMDPAAVRGDSAAFQEELLRLEREIARLQPVEDGQQAFADLVAATLDGPQQLAHNVVADIRDKFVRRTKQMLVRSAHNISQLAGEGGQIGADARNWIDGVAHDAGALISIDHSPEEEMAAAQSLLADFVDPVCVEERKIEEEIRSQYNAAPGAPILPLENESVAHYAQRFLDLRRTKWARTVVQKLPIAAQLHAMCAEPSG